MELNWPAEKLYSVLQHRPPMAWIDRVVGAREESGKFFGECIVNLSEDSLFMRNRKSPSGASAIEFCAQAYGFSRACYQELYNIDFAPTQTYLSSVSRCKTDFASFSEAKEDHLKVEVQTKKVTHPLVFIDGRVLGSSGKLYAELSFTLFIA